MKRVLFVAYAFPPVGGVGVHRVVKFVKYLPEFGWTSSVLTVSNPSVPLIDESLLKDVPASTIVRKAKTLEPGYALKKSVSGGQKKAGGSSEETLEARVLGAVKKQLRQGANLVLQPDAQVLWRPHAIRAGLALLREVPHDVIVATGPPFSSLVLGAALGRRSKVPLILDYRDEWGISNAYWENKGQGAISNAIQKRMQLSAVRAATALLATTKSSAAHLAEVAREAGATAFSTHITNGFDPDDFTHAHEARRARKDYGNGIGLYRLSFIGTLWNLNSIEPLVRGIEELASRPDGKASLAGLELVVAGRRTPEQESFVDRLNALCTVVRLPFVSHDEAVAMMQEADALLMLNADLPDTQRIINAKTFEYMAARRPMFVVAPKGDVWDIVGPLPGTVLCPPREPRTIADALARELARHARGEAHEGSWDTARFERRQLAGELAELLDRVAGLEGSTHRRAATGSTSASARRTNGAGA